jgi:hypothetical protein
VTALAESRAFSSRIVGEDLREIGDDDVDVGRTFCSRKEAKVWSSAGSQRQLKIDNAIGELSLKQLREAVLVVSLRPGKWPGVAVAVGFCEEARVLPAAALKVLVLKVRRLRRLFAGLRIFPSSAGAQYRRGFGVPS